MDQERISFLSLHFIPGVGDFLVKQLVSYCGSAEQVFKTPKGKLLKIPGVGAISADAIKKGNSFSRCRTRINKSRKRGY